MQQTSAKLETPHGQFRLGGTALQRESPQGSDLDTTSSASLQHASDASLYPALLLRPRPQPRVVQPKSVLQQQRAVVAEQCRRFLSRQAVAVLSQARLLSALRGRRMARTCSTPGQDFVLPLGDQQRRWRRLQPSAGLLQPSGAARVPAPLRRDARCAEQRQ
ncbi:unannotated protein [freshwater metagenome]|uniref:Unannotated protein n=1 Tax=freshwater metagenome TaxID=449393 RepID=A0A6J7U342_9ZZZZ